MISYVELASFTKLNKTRIDSTALIIPPPIKAGITGVNVVEITLIIRFTTLPFSSSASS